MSLVYLNGEFKSLEQANINVLDRGFTFGDGVYEVIPVFNRKIFRAEQHLLRLEKSLTDIYMDNPLSYDEWINIFEILIEPISEPEQSIYLQITRGVSPRDHDISLSVNPTVFAMSRPIEKKDFSNGIKAITHEDIRWQYCDIKAITLLPSVLLRHRAKLQDAKEAILVRDNIVTEGAASNVFICQNGRIITPPKDNKVLPGITRDLLLEILTDSKLDFVETVVTRDDLLSADEVWLTSSTWEVVPVIQLDDRPVGDGVPGPLWKNVNQLYQKYKDLNCR